MAIGGLCAARCVRNSPSGARRIREMSPPSTLDSTALIREYRDTMSLIVDAVRRREMVRAEEGTEAAQALLEAVTTRCSRRSLLLVEVANALWKKWKRGRDRARASSGTDLEARIPFSRPLKSRPDRHLANEARIRGAISAIRFYDCLYLALTRAAAGRGL